MNRITLFLILLFFKFNLFAQFNSVDRLILDMPCNGNANDISGNNNNGIVHGATLVTDRFNTPNGAYDFQVANHASIEVPASPSMDSVTLMSGYTISAWIKARSWNSGGTPLLAIFERHNLTNDGGSDFLAFPFGPYFLGKQGNFNFQLGTWYNVAVTINPVKDSMVFYVDGNVVGNFFFNTPVDTSNHGPYSIGTSLTGSDEYSDGTIDNIKIYARALTNGDLTKVNTLVANKRKNLNFEVYPNPASDLLHIEMSGINSEFPDIQFVNLLGEVTLGKQLKNNDEFIDIKNLDPGVYLIRCVTESGTIIKKFIKL